MSWPPWGETSGTATIAELVQEVMQEGGGEGDARLPQSIQDLDLEGEFWRSQEMTLALFSIPKVAPLSNHCFLCCAAAWCAATDFPGVSHWPR